MSEDHIPSAVNISGKMGASPFGMQLLTLIPQFRNLDIFISKLRDIHSEAFSLFLCDKK